MFSSNIFWRSLFWFFTDLLCNRSRHVLSTTTIRYVTIVVCSTTLYSLKLVTHFSPTGDGIDAKAFLFGNEGACTSSGDNCAKRILRALAAGLSDYVGQTRADEGSEDALVDTGIVEGSMSIGSEMIYAVVAVCQRQAWN